MRIEDCPFCNLQHLTPWYVGTFPPPDGSIVVCEDLDPKGYDLRLLVVIAGPSGHVDRWTPEQHTAALEALETAWQKLTEGGAAWQEVLLNSTEKTITGHEHYQLCLRRLG